MSDTCEMTVWPGTSFEGVCGRPACGTHERDVRVCEACGQGLEFEGFVIAWYSRRVSDDRPESQCRALAISLHMNCCMLREGHAGRHRNSLGQEFTGAVSRATQLHDAIVALCGCAKHKRYRAMRKPRAACEGCWRLWILTHPDRELESRWMSR